MDYNVLFNGIHIFVIYLSTSKFYRGRHQALHRGSTNTGHHRNKFTVCAPASEHRTSNGGMTVGVTDCKAESQSDVIREQSGTKSDTWVWGGGCNKVDTVAY